MATSLRSFGAGAAGLLNVTSTMLLSRYWKIKATGAVMKMIFKPGFRWPMNIAGETILENKLLVTS